MQQRYKQLKQSLGGDYFAAKAAARLAQRKTVKNDTDESPDENEEKRVVLNAEAPDKRIVVNTQDETVDVTAVLATTEERSDGTYFPEEELKRMAKQINKDGIAEPGFSHHDIDEAMKKAGNNPDVAKEKLQEKRGFLGDIKAFVEDGRLWAEMQLEKAYQSAVDLFENLSVEAISDVRGSQLINSEIHGFVFTNKPELDGAEIKDAS